MTNTIQLLAFQVLVDNKFLNHKGIYFHQTDKENGTWKQEVSIDSDKTGQQTK